MFALTFGFGTLFFGGLIFFSSWFKGGSAWAFLCAWGIKLCASLFLLYVYTQVYPIRQEADIFKYYDDGLVLSEIANEKPAVFTRIMLGAWSDADLYYLNRLNYWFRSYDHGIANDNRIVIRVNALLNLITRGSYGLNLVVFLALSWLGSYWLFRLFMELSASKITSYIAAFLLPSTVFWSSGILKEALLLFALGGFLYSFYQVHLRLRLGFLLLGLGCLFMLLFLKIYILMALLPLVIFTWVWTRTPDIRFRMGSIVVLLTLLIVVQWHCFPSWSMLSTLQGKQFDFIQMAHAVKAGSLVPIIPMDGRWTTLLTLIPIGIWNVLVYPTIDMVKNPQSVLAFTENLIIMLIIIGTLFRLKRFSWKLDWRFPMLVFGLTIFALVGMTAPVVGAMVRYKAPVLPFLLMSLFHYQLPSVKQIITSNKIYQWLNTHL